MANKPHLAISTEHLKSGCDHQVVCGAVVEKAKELDIYFLEPGHRFGMEVFDKELRGLCTKCRKWLAEKLSVTAPDSKVTEYLYVFQRGDGKEELESA